jgi:nucleoside 2-deoxyribosyltransferase
MPAGKSGHLELGYMIGCGKPCIIYFNEEPDDDRWDVMVQFAFENGGDVCFGMDDLKKTLLRLKDDRRDEDV